MFSSSHPVFGNLQEWNRGAERLFGFTKDEAVGKRLVQDFIADECHGDEFGQL